MDFSAWIVSGLMVVAGATWLIVYNADVAARGDDARRSAGSARSRRCSRWRWPTRCATRFRTGVTLAMFTLVVFTIVVGATTSRAFLRAVDDVGELRRRLRRARRGRAAEPARRRRRPRSAAPGWIPPTSASSAASRSCPPSVRQAGDAGTTRTYPRPRLRRAVPPGTRRTRSPRWRDGLRLAARRSGTRCAARPTSPWSTSSPPRVAPTGASPRRPTSACTASTSRTRRSTRCRSRSATPHSGTTRTLTVIGVLADTVAASTWPACGRRSGRPRPLFGARARAHHPPPRARARRRPGPRRARARARVPRQRPGGRSRRASDLHDAVGASYTLNWLLLGFMGLGLSSASPRSA